jgi:hypothetical protein
MDRRENRIVADHRQRVVKRQVGENEGRLIGRIAIGIEGLAQDFELVARGLLGGAPCEADLEKHARVLKLPDAIRPTKHMTGGPGEIVDERIGIRSRHTRGTSRLRGAAPSAACNIACRTVDRPTPN